jgi:WD40 repeat protein
VAEAAAKKSRVIALLASVRKRNQEVLAVKKGFDRLQPFLDRLKKDPKDAQANFKLGQYFGLLKGKWERALPLLALGSDEALKALAARDLARPKDGKDQLAVADGWWDLAAKQKDPAQLHMLLRAGYWYEQAALNVTGLSRTKALKRIEKIAALGQPAVPVRPPGKVGHIRTFEGSGDEVKSVAFSPDARSAVSGGKDNTVRLWDLVGGKEIRSFKGHTKEIWTVAFHPNGRQVFSASWDATVRLWDVAGGKDPRTFTHPKDVNGLAVTRDGQWLLTGCDDETMRLWSLASGQVTKTYTGHSGYVYGVAFSADGKYVGSGGQDRTVRVYDRTSGQKVREITGPTGPTYIVAFSPDGRYVFSCGDSAARMWEVATGKEIRKFEGKGSSGYVNCLALSQDGRRLVTGHEDKSVRLWDVATGKELQRFEGHTDSVECVAISADGFHALSGGKDRTIRLWGLP